MLLIKSVPVNYKHNGTFSENCGNFFDTVCLTGLLGCLEGAKVGFVGVIALKVFNEVMQICHENYLSHTLICNHFNDIDLRFVATSLFVSCASAGAIYKTVCASKEFFTKSNHN